MPASPLRAETFENVVVGAKYYRKGFLSDPLLTVISKDRTTGLVRVVDQSDKMVRDVRPSELLSARESTQRDLVRIEGGLRLLGAIIGALSEDPPPPARSQWSPGAAHPDHPNVVAGTTRNKWHPANGYVWRDRETSWRVIWKPGQNHPVHPNVIAADDEGKWRPGPGYRFADIGKSWKTEWRSGLPHPRYNGIVSSQTEGSWRTEPGYRWSDPNNPDIRRVTWTSDLPHPVYPNVVSSSAERVWKPAPGYRWATSTPEHDEFSVAWDPGQRHPRDFALVANFTEGDWINGALYWYNMLILSDSRSDRAQSDAPDVDGSLMAPEDYDIYTDFKASAWIFHARDLPYDEIAHLEMHYDHSWIVVVMKDGRRLDIGGRLPARSRISFRENEVVRFGQTKDGELIDEISVPLVMLAGDNLRDPEERVMIGVRIKDVARHDFETFSIWYGTEVEDVIAGSPADEAGVLKGDLILSVDGQTVYDQQHLIALIAASEGKAVRVGLVRGETGTEVLLEPRRLAMNE